MHEELFKGCPICPKRQTPRGEKDQPLVIVKDNYSGCGLDIAECDKCKNKFVVIYKIDTIELMK